MTESNREIKERMEITATLFPFVCGICFEKFNKIDVYYLHLQAHNQNTSDCFHICDNLKEKDKNIQDSKASRNIFRCGSCLKTFFSICTLHKHMQDIYDQGSYEFDHSLNTAFPKGDLGNLCLLADENEADFAKANIDNTSNNLEVISELESTCKRDYDAAKESNKTVKETKKSRKRKHLKVNDILISENETVDHGDQNEKINNSKGSTSSNSVNLDEPVQPIKRPRGRPPKLNHSTLSKSKENHSINSKVKTKTNKLIIPGENTGIKQEKGKINGEQEKLNRSKKKDKSKEKKMKGGKELHDAKFSSLTEMKAPDDLKPDVIQVDLNSEGLTVQHTESDTKAEEDKSIKSVSEFDLEQDNVQNTSKHISKGITRKKNTDESSVKEKVKKKRSKQADSESDGLSALEKKKTKKYFYTCPLCNKTMGLSHKKRHNAIHAAELEGKPKVQEFETCDICGKSVVKAGLKLHQALHSEDRPYLCDRCPKAFKLKSNLHHHKQIHDEFKPHACENCGKRFHRRTDLRFHLRVHTDERPVQCTQCPLRFRKTSTLNIHMKVHRGDKCHQCELCGKAFIRKDYLKRHMIWHNGQATHECEICGKKFMEKGGLQRHVKIHSEERSHVCDHCGKAFVLSSNLKQHVKKVHNNDKEKKQTTLNPAINDSEQSGDTGNQAEGTKPNLPDLQQFKESVPQELKTEEKAEYHTLMPRVREFELPTLTHLGQARNYAISQEFNPAQTPFYSSAPVGIVQVPYHEGTMMSHLALPPRHEITGETARHGFTEQQQAVQTISMQYTIADENMQHYPEM